METLHIQVINPKALEILNVLDELQLVKIIKADNIANKKLSAKYAGKLPPEIADEMLVYLTESR